MWRVTVGSATARDVDGGSGPDLLIGTAKADTIRGHGGRDRIYGMGGADTIYGGKDAKRDRLYGGSGNDRIYAYLGDAVYADSGKDVIWILTGTPWRFTTVDCGSGRDHVHGVGGGTPGLPVAPREELRGHRLTRARDAAEGHRQICLGPPPVRRQADTRPDRHPLRRAPGLVPQVQARHQAEGDTEVGGSKSALAAILALRDANVPSAWRTRSKVERAASSISASALPRSAIEAACAPSHPACPGRGAPAPQARRRHAAPGAGCHRTAC